MDFRGFDSSRFLGLGSLTSSIWECYLLYVCRSYCVKLCLGSGIRGWSAVSAAGLRGKGLPKRRDGSQKAVSNSLTSALDPITLAPFEIVKPALLRPTWWTGCSAMQFSIQRVFKSSICKMGSSSLEGPVRRTDWQFNGRDTITATRRRARALGDPLNRRPPLQGEASEDETSHPQDPSLAPRRVPCNANLHSITAVTDSYSALLCRRAP